MVSQSTQDHPARQIDWNRKTLKVQMMEEEGVPVRDILKKYDINGDGIFGVNEVMLIHEDLKESKDTTKNLKRSICVLAFCWITTMIVFYLLVFQANEASKEKVVRRHKGGNGEEIEVEETKNGDLVQTKPLESFGNLCSFTTLAKAKLDTVDYISFSATKETPPMKSFNFRMRVSSYTQDLNTKDLELSTQEGHKIYIFRDPNIRPYLQRRAGCNGECEIYRIPTNCEDAEYPPAVVDIMDSTEPGDDSLTDSQQEMLKKVPADKRAEAEAAFKKSNSASKKARRMQSLQYAPIIAEQERREFEGSRTHRRMLKDSDRYRKRHLEASKEAGRDEEDHHRRLASAPQDCVMSEWEPVQTCNKQCGPSTQTVRRFARIHASQGGIECEYDLEDCLGETQQMPCQIKECPVEKKVWCDSCVAKSASSSVIQGSLYPGYSKGTYDADAEPWKSLKSNIEVLGNNDDDFCKLQHSYCNKETKALWVFADIHVASEYDHFDGNAMGSLKTAAPDFATEKLKMEWKVNFYADLQKLQIEGGAKLIIDQKHEGNSDPAVVKEVQELCQCLNEAYGTSDGAASYQQDPKEMKTADDDEL